MGEAGRQRAISDFDWTSIALQTAKLYQEVAGSPVTNRQTPQGDPRLQDGS
jgi:hypothetical protein